MIKAIDSKGLLSELTYDEKNRLTAEYKGPLTTTYNYYKNDLRQSMTDTIGTTSYVYGNDNALVQETLSDGKTINYEYDINGNVTRV